MRFSGSIFARLMFALLLIFALSCGGAAPDQALAGQPITGAVPLHGHGSVNDGGTLNAQPYIIVSGALTIITSGAWTKIDFSVITSDSGGGYMNLTTDKYTPLVPGFYLISGAILGQGTTTMTELEGRIYKSTVGLFDTIAHVKATFGANSPVSLSLPATFVYLNGSTDYLEMFGSAYGTGTVSLTGKLSAIRLSN